MIEKILIKQLWAVGTGLLFGLWQNSWNAGAFMYCLLGIALFFFTED
jgi:hypothetical protein